MERYRQRTIAELLKKTSKLIRPRMTTILEGKDRMQGPLDITDPNIDFASIKVCGNCRNHLDASIAQYCGICKKGHHSFCLEAPPSEAADRSVQCCYDCQHKVDLDSNRPGSSLKDSHSELSEDRMDVYLSNENVPESEEPGTSYDTPDRSPVSKKMDLSWNETSPSKQTANSGGTVFDTLYKPTKTRAARKLGIRRKRVTDGFGSDSPSILPSETDMAMSMPAKECSGLDATLKVGSVLPTCCQPGSEESKDSDRIGFSSADIQSSPSSIRSRLEEANGNQMLEVHVGSPVKDSEQASEDTVMADKPAKEGNVTEAEKLMGSPKLDIAVAAHPASQNSCTALEGCLTDISTTLKAPSMAIQEEVRVVAFPTSRDSTKEESFLSKIYAVPQMIVEEDAGERQILIVRQVNSVEDLPKQDDDVHHFPAIADLPPQSTSHVACLATCHRVPAFDVPKSTSSFSSALDGQTEDGMSKPSVFMDVKRALPSILEEMDEHLSNDSIDKAGHMECVPHKELTSPKAHTDIDSSFAGSETTAAFLSSPNSRAAMEDEIKVCDLCGDSGYEDMLAICNECNGAEHVYCYENLMAQVPEGYWQCDVCKSKQKAGDYRSFTDVRTVTSRLPSFNSTRKHSNVGNSRSRLSALLQKRRLPSEKKRAMKGIPSSQFPAKRGLPMLDAPPTKKQAVEASSPPYTPSAASLKVGLTKEASFKIPDTGKVKAVSHATLMGPTGEGMGLSSRGSGKFLLSTGLSSSSPHNSSMAQSGQMSKGRFSSASNSILGPGNARVNASSSLNTSSTSVPPVSSGMKASAALKSSESVPSFLLSLKPTGSKFQPSLKSLKETSDNFGLQSSPKEGLSISSSKPLNKTGSFKLPKGTSLGSSLEPKLRQDASSDSAKVLGSRNVHTEVGFVKPAESKYEAVSNSGLPDMKSKALAATVSLETHMGVDKLMKMEPVGNLQIPKEETLLDAFGTYETQRGSALSSPVKEVQDLNIEQEKKSPFQVTSPQPLARQTSKLPEKEGAETLKEVVTTTSTDATQSSPLMIRPVLVIQESLTIKGDEKKPLQLAVSTDADGDKNVLAVGEKTSPQDDNRSSFTPRSRAFGAWVSPSYVPSLGSTRCYRCKELGHSAKNCNNRTSTGSVSSEAVGTLKVALPASNVDSTCVSKVATPISVDNATRSVQSNVEAIPKMKPTTEAATTIKPSSSERGVVFTQNLNSFVGEGPVQVEEGQVVEDAVPSLCPLVNQVMRNDGPVLKHIAESPSKVSAEATPFTNHTTETSDGKKELDSTSMRIVDSTIMNVSSGAQSTTSSTECQPPLLPLPSLTRNMSATFTPVSSTNLKATSPFVSRYQESLKVYPEAQIVWQGTFEVSGKASPQVSFHGLQANPSNRALPKVREVAKKLQPLLPLEELPRGSEHNSWPVQFQKSPPINDNIALYFFASSKESYVQYYKPLVDRLIKFDLTLKGFIEDAELLIFPSNLLPPGFQCWNNFMFLWAVFRARKLPIKQLSMSFTTFELKPAGIDTGSKEPLQAGVLPWGKAEDMQVDTNANKTINIPQVAGNKSETPSLTIAESAKPGRPGALADSDVVVVCDPSPPCEQEPHHPMQVVAAKEERNAQVEAVHSQPEKALAFVGPSTQDSIVVKSQLSSDVFLATEGCLNVSASNESSQKLNSSIVLEEKFQVDTTVELVVSSAPKVSSVLVKSEQGNIEKAKHSTPLMGTLPALLVCSSPRDKQEEVWTPRKLSSHSPAGYQDKDKGVRERVYEKSDKMESGRGVSRDRDRERQRDREKHKERDRDRERSRRHSDWERERERERAKERERDRDRERERDRGRERERERDRERWRERDDRDRRSRDWDRDRDKVGDRGRDRGRERESERERALTRERSRHRHWEAAEADYGRSGRHWYRHPRSRSPSRSPLGNRDLSPSRPRPDRYHRYHRSFRHSRSYSHSPDSDHGLTRLQPTRAESRDLSKDSFAPKGKSPDIVAEESRAKEESAVKNSVVKGSGGDEQGNYSQRGSNSNSLCRDNSAGKERKLPIADLNLSPSEIEETEEEGNDDEVTMSVEVAMQCTATHPDEQVSGCQEFLPVSGHGRELGECSISAGKMCTNQSTERFMCGDDSRSLSLINDSSDPSCLPLNVPLDRSSSCLDFFPQPMEDDHRAASLPDLSLGLGAKEQSPPQQAELPLFMQLLEPCQGSSRGGSGPLAPSLDAPMVSEQADLSLSLGIPEHSKRPVVNTSLRLFG